MYLYLLLALFLSATSAELLNNNEYKLKKKIFENYDKTTRPVEVSQHGLTLNFSIAITQLLDLSVKEQKLEIATWLYYYWKDHNLKWEPDEYGGLNEVIINPGDVWIPDFYLYNSVNAAFDQRFKTPAKLFNDGLIRWCAPSNLEASCKSDVYYFPFDVQNCTFNFGTWTATANQLDVYPVTDAVQNFSYSPSEEWEYIRW